LEELYKKIKEKHGMHIPPPFLSHPHPHQTPKLISPGDDFTILGFPCNQFGGQEPGTNDDIQSFCQVNYGVSFPIMGKTDVNGDKANPLFEWLKSEQPGLLGMKRVKWNFEKFLVGRDGKVKGRWASTTKPETLEKPILEELSVKSEL
jgi:glutathione peroxidase-family protein